MSRQDGLYRDRDGELVTAPPQRGKVLKFPTPKATTPACPHDCDNGWLGSSIEPRPCPTCKADTVRRLQAQREKCSVCRTRLDPVLVEDGYRTHPECDPYEGARDLLA